MSADGQHALLLSNQDALRADLAVMRARFEALARDGVAPAGAWEPRADTVRHLRSACGLSAFETSLLMLAVAVELDAAVAALCGRLAAQESAGGASFALASRLFDDADWRALLPTAPLRYWRLVDVEPRRHEKLAESQVKVSERVLHHVAGLVYLDESLHPLVTVCEPSRDVWPGHADAAARLARHWAGHPEAAIVVTGSDARSRRLAVARACADLGLRLFVIRSEDIPVDPVARDRFTRVWMRDALLAPAVLLVDGDTSPAVAALVDRVATALAVSATDGAPPANRSFLHLHLAPATTAERKASWRSALGDRGGRLGESLDTLAAQFELSAGQIAAAIESAEDDTPRALWQASRLQARPSLGELARRIDSEVRWDDLVLPPAVIGVLRQIATHVRRRRKVYDDWGFGAERRGLGITALFAGMSGTGKTMAGEVLATDLQLDLYRIDLSQVVSKYIGETEKNLRRVFDAADGGSVILLFDEADALFGKRSEVKDSHDRYANIEVSYLLQRMEEYRGLAILTTNQRSALDQAFLRRLRFVVEFPFPDLEGRAEIWRRVFPAATPLDGLETDKLARLNVAGGNIRNIAMNAAFLAADAGRAVRMSDLLVAARTECAKIQRTVSDAEVRGWM